MPLPFRLSRRSLLKAAARLGVGAALAGLGIGRGAQGSAQDESGGGYFRESATRLTLGNRYYEVDFDKGNGAITRIFDKRGGGVVSEGNAGGSLWSLLRQTWAGQGGHANKTYLWSGQANRSDFAYRWEPVTRSLSFQYHIDRDENRVRVAVEIDASHREALDLRAVIQNLGGPRIDWLGFPQKLAFRAADINQALIAKLPGMLLQPSFFESGQSQTESYPGGTLCGDLTWVDHRNGRVSVFQIGRQARAPVLFGWEHQPGSSPPLTGWKHDFALGIEPGARYETPVVRIAVGKSLPATIADYRTANGIDEYPSLSEKLGDVSEIVAHAPFLKMGHYGWGPVSSLAELVDTTEPAQAPALLHHIAITEQDFDRQNPDWWPPRERVGGAAEYRLHFRAAQREGFSVTPYMNPTWWCPTSITNGWLQERGVALEEIATRNPDGEANREQYCDVNYGDGNRDTFDFYNCKPGVTASPSDPLVRERLDLLMQQQVAEHSDLVLEDQIGARPWLWDYHPSSPSPLSYSDAWLAHNQRHATRRLMTESGDDQLAQVQSGFAGTMLSWEHFLRRNHGGKHWIYYPLTAMMLRDKTGLYQHPAEGHGSPSVTESLRMLRWNLAYGHRLNFDLVASNSPWLPVVTAFSHHVVAGYAGQLLSQWQGEPTEITISGFATATVTANWTEIPHVVGEHTLVPGGVVSTYHDGSVTGGVFERYNGRELSPGEHYLIEQRKAQGAIIRQPMGEDTPLTLHGGGDWSSGAEIALRAFNRSDELLRINNQRISGGDVRFTYERVAADATARRGFQASIALAEGNREDGLREVDLSWTTTVAATRDGRECRREIQLTGLEPDAAGFISFALERDILGAVAEADVLVEVDWWDGGGLPGSRHDSLGLVYDGAVFDSGQRHTVARGWSESVNDQQWKTARFTLPRAVFRKRVWDAGVDFALVVPGGVCIGKVTVTNANELERRTVAYYTIHDPTQGETLAQGLHLRGWTDATQPIADLDLDGIAAIFAWDTEGEHWLMYSPNVPPQLNTLERLEQGRAYYVRVANGRTLHWPEAPYGGNGFLLQPGRNLVCWLGTPDKPLTDAIAPLRGMKAEPLVSVSLGDVTYDVEESRTASEPLAYGQAVWVEIDAVGPTRWLQF